MSPHVQKNGMPSVQLSGSQNDREHSKHVNPSGDRDSIVDMIIALLQKGVHVRVRRRYGTEQVVALVCVKIGGSRLHRTSMPPPASLLSALVHRALVANTHKHHVRLVDRADQYLHNDLGKT